MNLCKTCKAEIIWVETATSPRHPLNAKSEKRFIKDSSRTFILIDTFISHFATCPDADKFRKPKGVK